MYYEPKEYAFIEGFSDQWPAIRDEYRSLDAPVLDIHRIGDLENQADLLLSNHGWTPSWQVGSTEPNYSWLTYLLSYKGRVAEAARDKVPVTAELVSNVKGCRVSALSLLRGTSFIAPHFHGELPEGMLTFHLGLDVVPKKSFLCVRGDMREEANRRAIVFDSRREHFAINMSNADRVILYVEFDSLVQPEA